MNFGGHRDGHDMAEKAMDQMRTKALDLRRAGQADIELANALDRAAADRDEKGGAA